MFESHFSLEDTVHIIQLALTPVFLLSGIATLLTVFSNRLARVADKLDRLSEIAANAKTAKHCADLSGQMAFLRKRSHTLDAAVILGTLAGVSTCGATLTLFIGVLRASATSTVLFLLFGLALTCTLGALGAYLLEMLLASRGIRAEAMRQEKSLDARGQ